MWDVIIVGGGPAGATLARLVGRRYRTLLVERRSDPPRAPGPGAAKCCGGLLAPDAQRALAALGLGVPRDVLVGPQLFAVRAVDLAAGLERHYPRFYVNLDRGRFDAWLRALVPREVVVATGCRVSAVRAERDHVAVELDGPGATTVERARLLVGADGAASLVRRRVFPRAPEPEAYVAVQEWFEARAPDACYTAVFDPGVTDFYGWAIPKAGRVVVGAALRPAPDVAARFATLLRALQDAGVRLGASRGREGTMLYRPRRGSELLTGAGRVALVGEAAGFVSPSSAEGISWALRSVCALDAALAPGLEGWAARYAARTAGLRGALWLKRLKAPALYAPAIRRAILRSGVGAVPVGEPPPEDADAPLAAR